MKKSYILGTLALAAMSLTGCDDFLNDNRFPLSEQTANDEFWNNPVNVQNQVNRFLNDYAGYGDRSSTNGTFYFSTLSDDQCGRRSFTNWTFTSVPASSSSWNAPYEEIRGANEVIENVAKSTMSTADIENFTAIARLHRARNYFNLVRRYGDVPLIKIVLDPTNEAELFGPRTPRNEVVDFILEDLDYAAAHMAATSSATTFSQDLAKAVKLEVCLFEGAYAKYHKNDAARSKKYFEEAVKAGEALAAKYTICDDYTSLYKAFNVDGGGYKALASNPEIIFCKNYVQGVFMHSLCDYSSASDGVAGITRDAFESFLFLDGRPAASTTLDKTDLGVPEDGGLSIANLLAVRDQRLAMTTYDHVLMPGMTFTGPNTAAMWSMTGYGVSKYNNFTIPEADVNQANKNYVCAPLFWGARVYIGVAEAKAELGTLGDADVTKYIKPLWDRAGIDTSKLNKAWLEGMNDPANNMNVSSLIWEVRRCRRCELMMDDDIRYWDLIRWHQLDKLDTTKNPKIAQGANVSNSPVAGSALTGNYLNCTYGTGRTFEDKYYFYPLPSDQCSLNTELNQNPGW